MVKEQKRGNREAKKPKKVKAPAAPVTASFVNKGVSSQLSGGKKK